jgi:hypothetical protein
MISGIKCLRFRMVFMVRPINVEFPDPACVKKYLTCHLQSYGIRIRKSFKGVVPYNLYGSVISGYDSHGIQLDMWYRYAG